MTEEEEASFLEEWHKKSVAGTIVTIPELHAALSQRLGKKIPFSTTYRMLKRHGWRKIKPDTRHPKGDPKKQDKFKKKHFQNLWRKFP
jgi:transposase